MNVAMEHIHYEDENSNYLCIGCIEKVAHKFFFDKLFDMLLSAIPHKLTMEKGPPTFYLVKHY